MRILPDNPSLDHLRRQAKDLLAGLRESAPTTTLARAQAALAEQYGFRTWTDLKAEVDRRRGSATTAPPALADVIAGRYGLGRVTGQMRRVAAADAGYRWLLPTERGRWAVQSLDTWLPIVDIETGVKLQEAAAVAGVLSPAPVRSTAGEFVETIGGHRWRVTAWLHDGPPLLAPASSAVTREVGRILATIHGLGLPADRISPWHAARLSSTPWTELVTAASAAGADWAPALAEAVPALDELATLGDGSPTGIPVLSHNVLGPAMVRLARDGRLVVCDWEYAGGQPPAWELSDVLTHWAIGPDGRVNVAGARALVEGYAQVTGTVPPLSLATFRGAGISLVNYVQGQVETALAASGDGRRDADRSVRHVLAHLPTATAFNRLLEAVA